MFSGIVQELGTIEKITTNNNVKTFQIKFDNSSNCKIGDSVAINGTCLTVTELNGNTASFDTVPETLEKTSLDTLKIGDKVNTELAMRYGDHVGGHMVQGHIDETGQIKSIQANGYAWIVEISASNDFLAYLVEKGFVTIDGMSITVIDVLKESFTVTLIPHTIEVTIAQGYTEGSFVNLEADATGKYIYKYITGLNKNV
ncbi:riboflavin synthase subunit alpha [Candidatus Francisella endociliophora]|uniref:Riboflavin synthase n=1 Tax=Candidatus Francisella endociliophora TaxID=653937 RepID=A0A097EQ44_9GAMM|nr:riboflavin synthase [Francisella sp. FSC1006]AIT09687.1 riboflavin synthase subunit alpha [Francisella sp. FSC1006]